MASALVTVAVVFYFILLFCSNGIAKIFSARQCEITKQEKERTEQKRLELEIAKVQNGVVSSDT